MSQQRLSEKNIKKWAYRCNLPFVKIFANGDLPPGVLEAVTESDEHYRIYVFKTGLVELGKLKYPTHYSSCPNSNSTYQTL